MSDTRLTAKFLATPAPYAVRIIASERLKAVRGAYKRFEAGEQDGLHDLRVALRRLRSWLRAYRSEIDDTLRRKTRRRLTALSDITNAARDAEVALAWIASLPELPERAIAGRDHIARCLQQERDSTTAIVRSTLERDLADLLRDLARQLAPHAKHRHAKQQMRAVVEVVLREHGQWLAESLTRVASPEETVLAHRARIAAKRLRYLLQPLDVGRRAITLEARVEVLQDTLGVFLDSQKIASRLVTEIGVRAAFDARLRARATLHMKGEESENIPAFGSLRPGLLALARRARQSEQKAFAAFRRRWGPIQIERMTTEMVAITNAI